MNFTVHMLLDADEKSACARSILEKCCKWFANVKSREEYIVKVRELDFWIAESDAGECVGFFAGTCHYGTNAEIVVCAVDPDVHGSGVGSALSAAMEKYYSGIGCDKMLVKTLSDVVDDEDYAMTRKFYTKCGFLPLITLYEMWDEENPCLIMIKNLPAGGNQYDR